ncbi:MAG: class I SAM-dependent methyltransferase, partial [Patescibacteria group bacterium]
MKKIYLNKFRRLSEHCKTGNVLDVGCSALPNPFLRDAYGLDVIMPDVYPENYRVIKLSNLNIQSFPFEDGFFHNVIAGDVIEHLENPSFFLREANRVLKYGGLIVLCTPQANDWWVTLHNWFFRSWINDPDPGEHLQNWTILDMMRLLKKNGFKVRRVEGLYFKSPLIPIHIRVRRFP